VFPPYSKKDFFAMHGNVARGIDAEAHLVAFHPQHGHRYRFTDYYRFADPARQNQHGVSGCVLLLNGPSFGGLGEYPRRRKRQSGWTQQVSCQSGGKAGFPDPRVLRHRGQGRKTDKNVKALATRVTENVICSALAWAAVVGIGERWPLKWEPYAEWPGAACRRSERLPMLLVTGSLLPVRWWRQSGVNPYPPEFPV
jgi:hypothetical protein